MPITQYLTNLTPLAVQVADVLLEGTAGVPVDLRGTQVWIPTAGAARRIRLALAEKSASLGTGVLPPQFVQPMQAMLRDDAGRPAASRFEREARGVEVKVLVWNPAVGESGFDAWGRPLAGEWGRCEIPLLDDQIAMTRDPGDEAMAAMGFVSGETGDYAIVLADPDLGAAFASEILRRGRTPFFPDGDHLAASEAAVVAMGWLEWLETSDLRTLRRLIESPGFAGWIGREAGLVPDEVLSACDFLAAEVLAETLVQARDYLDGPAGVKLPRGRGLAEKLVSALMKARKFGPEEVLRIVWKTGNRGAEEARLVLELWEGILASPVFRDWSEGRTPAFLSALKSAAIFQASQPGDVELSGWLEAPWTGAARLVVCGCVEGHLPSSVTEHPFLPDSKRAQLGLQDNASRRARDAYLLDGLTRVRPAEDFRCSFSKRGADGSPALPSSLLLRGPEAGLPGRVLELFSEPPAAVGSAKRQNSWRWSLPASLRVGVIGKISPTDFKEYLACPFRFYFSRVLHLEGFDPRAREMDALRFGTLVHKVLENFAMETPGEADEEKIAFGPGPPRCGGAECLRSHARAGRQGPDGSGACAPACICPDPGARVRCWLADRGRRAEAFRR